MATPLASWADTQIRAIAKLSGSAAVLALTGEAILRMRGPRDGPATCRFYPAKDGHVAINLARADDAAMLPALFGKAGVLTTDIAAEMAQTSASEVVGRGRTLGLALAHLDERPVNPACVVMASGQSMIKMPERLTVVDLSALWAGPLAGHLLSLSGASVIKIESSNRPDAMRVGDPALFAWLNDRKAHRSFDLRTPAGRDAVIAMIHYADIVIEAARPRALLQLGIDADALVADIPGLVWVTITGHGALGEAANWIGFGDDTSVAGGLSAALFHATGEIAVVGDAMGDPLTGLYAARMALEQRVKGTGARLGLSMSGVVAKALDETPGALPTC
jgi:CoA-transferase family III